MSVLPAPLPEAIRRLYLAEMGIDAYRLRARAEAQATPAESPASTRQAPEPAPAPVRTEPLPRSRGDSAAAADEGAAVLRCYGPTRSPVLVLLNLPRLPLAHPAGNEFRHSLGALLAALERRPDQAFVIAMTGAAPRELLLASLPPAARVALGFGVDPELSGLLRCPLLSMSDQPPPARARPAWKRQCWPLLRQARRLLELRVDP